MSTAAISRYGAILPTNTSAGAERHDGELLERARLALAHHAESGRDRADEDEDEAEQARDHDHRTSCSSGLKRTSGVGSEAAAAAEAPSGGAPTVGGIVKGSGIRAPAERSWLKAVTALRAAKSSVPSTRMARRLAHSRAARGRPAVGVTMATDRLAVAQRVVGLPHSRPPGRTATTSN